MNEIKRVKKNRLDYLQEQYLKLTNLKLEVTKTKVDRVYILIEITLDDEI